MKPRRMRILLLLCWSGTFASALSLPVTAAEYDDLRSLVAALEREHPGCGFRHTPLVDAILARGDAAIPDLLRTLQESQRWNQRVRALAMIGLLSDGSGGVAEQIEAHLSSDDRRHVLEQRYGVDVMARFSGDPHRLVELLAADRHSTVAFKTELLQSMGNEALPAASSLFALATSADRARTRHEARLALDAIWPDGYRTFSDPMWRDLPALLILGASDALRGEASFRIAGERVAGVVRSGSPPLDGLRSACAHAASCAWTAAKASGGRGHRALTPTTAVRAVYLVAATDRLLPALDIPARAASRLGPISLQEVPR